MGFLDGWDSAWFFPEAEPKTQIHLLWFAYDVLPGNTGVEGSEAGKGRPLLSDVSPWTLGCSYLGALAIIHPHAHWSPGEGCSQAGLNSSLLCRAEQGAQAKKCRCCGVWVATKG
jgi:hypothetical protein